MPAVSLTIIELEGAVPAFEDVRKSNGQGFAPDAVAFWPDDVEASFDDARDEAGDRDANCAGDTAGAEDALRDAAVSWAPPTFKVLVLRQEGSDCIAIEQALRHMPVHEAQVALAGTRRAGLFALSCDIFDVVILECADLADFDCAIISLLSGKGVDCPVVAVGRRMSPSAMKDALLKGAAVCLDKADVSPEIFQAVLPRVIQEAVGRRDQALPG